MSRSRIAPRLLLVLITLLALAALAAPVVGGVSPSPSDPGSSPSPAPSASPSSVATPAPGTASPTPSGTPLAGPKLCEEILSASPTPVPPPPTPGPSGAPTPSPTAAPVLCPAPLKGDPISLLSWLFTPIFQVLFMGLVLAYNVLGDIGLAIVVVTVIIRILLVPVFRRQIVSQRQMQLLQPEIKAIQQKFKGDRARISQEQMRIYKDRGINPAAGCLPGLLQLVLLVPMYSVFTSGLQARDISSMLQLFGVNVLNVACEKPGDITAPCINPIVHWLPDLTKGGLLDAGRPEVLVWVIPGIFGLSLLALISALLQLAQTRMMMPSSMDPQARSQQRLFLILPLFSLLYGHILPAGLFIYWIVTTVFSIAQQYLIAGFGSLFPLFGWTPGFARDHTPRFPVPALTTRKQENGEDEPPSRRRTPTDRAAGTVRPARTRGRSNRRGRRR